MTSQFRQPDWVKRKIRGIIGSLMLRSRDSRQAQEKFACGPVPFLRSLCAGFSFAPSGLALVAFSTHGLRRGLYSCAASRLNSDLIQIFDLSGDLRGLLKHGRD